MQVQNFILFLFVSGMIVACNQKAKTEVVKMEVKEVTLVQIEDDMPLPPPELTTKYKTLQDWLFNICDDEQPKMSISKYNIGLFESADDTVIFLAGINEFDNKDTSYRRIEFEPPNMYFQLPVGYTNLNRDQLLSKLMAQLKDFIKTEKFKTSFLANADSIVFSTNGQTIWVK